MKIIKCMGVWLGTALLVGCVTRPVAVYQPSFDNISLLKSAITQPMQLRKLTSPVSEITIRGARGKSPVGGDFGDYVREALAAEMQRAQLWLPTSEYQLSGGIIETDIHAASIITGHATLTVEFVMTRVGAEVFRRRYSARTEWESSFLGELAINRALESYPKVVTDVLRQLYSDVAFAKAFD